MHFAHIIRHTPFVLLHPLASSSIANNAPPVAQLIVVFSKFLQKGCLLQMQVTLMVTLEWEGGGVWRIEEEDNGKII